MSVSLIKCPICFGTGCANCRGSGVLGVDESGAQYFVESDDGGNWQVVGRKEGSGELRFSDRLFALLERLTAEPHDIIWAVKQISGRKNSSN